MEPLKFENGRPSDTMLRGGNALPSFFVPSARVQDLVSKNDTRLRIFSGTANPALAQVRFTL